MPRKRPVWLMRFAIVKGSRSRDADNSRQIATRPRCIMRYITSHRRRCCWRSVFTPDGSVTDGSTRNCFSEYQTGTTVCYVCRNAQPALTVSGRGSTALASPEYVATRRAAWNVVVKNLQLTGEGEGINAALAPMAKAVVRQRYNTTSQRTGGQPGGALPWANAAGSR